MKKRIIVGCNQLIIIASLIFLMACGNDKSEINNFKKSVSWSEFKWRDAEISGQFIEKVSINLPMNIEGIPHDFTAQFDLGATRTILYGNSIDNYLKTYPEFSSKIDTTDREVFIQNKRRALFKSVDFKVGDITFSNEDVVYFDGFGSEIPADSLETLHPKHIGTIGADIFQDYILIIDYPANRIGLAEYFPDNMRENVDFIDMRVENGRIKIPIIINDDSSHVMFDTGSSMAALLFTEKDWRIYRDKNAPVDTLRVSSWGEMLDTYGSKMGEPVYIGNQKFTDAKIFSTPTFADFFEREEIIGLMGNAFFLNHQLVIDFENKKFGISTDLFK